MGFDFNIFCVADIARSIRAEHEAAGEMSPARDWLEDVLGLPFAGLPNHESLISLLLAAEGVRAEHLITVAVDGLSEAFHWAREIEAYGEYYDGGTDRTEPVVASAATQVA